MSNDVFRSSENFTLVQIIRDIANSHFSPYGPFLFSMAQLIWPQGFADIYAQAQGRGHIYQAVLSEGPKGLGIYIRQIPMAMV